MTHVLLLVKIFQILIDRNWDSSCFQYISVLAHLMLCPFGIYEPAISLFSCWNQLYHAYEKWTLPKQHIIKVRNYLMQFPWQTISILGEGPDGGCFWKRKDKLLVRQTARHIGQPKSWEKERNLEEGTHMQTIKGKERNAYLKTATKIIQFSFAKTLDN